MSRVNGVDGKKIDFTYQSSFGGAEPYRISYMGQSTATLEGSSLAFEYGYNNTKLTDSEGRTATYEFNDQGNTVCVIGFFKTEAKSYSPISKRRPPSRKRLAASSKWVVTIATHLCFKGKFTRRCHET
jgi:hypothetical protein